MGAYLELLFLEKLRLERPFLTSRRLSRKPFKVVSCAVTDMAQEQQMYGPVVFYTESGESFRGEIYAVIFNRTKYYMPCLSPNGSLEVVATVSFVLTRSKDLSFVGLAGLGGGAFGVLCRRAVAEADGSSDKLN